MYVIKAINHNELPTAQTESSGDIPLTREARLLGSFDNPAGRFIRDITAISSRYGGGTNDAYTADLVAHESVEGESVIFGGTRGLIEQSFVSTLGNVDFSNNLLTFPSEANLNIFAQTITRGQTQTFPEADVNDGILRPLAEGSQQRPFYFRIGTNEAVVGPNYGTNDHRVITPSALAFRRTNQGGLAVAIQASTTRAGVNLSWGGTAETVTSGTLTVTDGDDVRITGYSYYTEEALTSVTRLYPADRCVFNVGYTGRNYTLTTADFYPGNAAAIQLDRPELGYIGKSGRFVQIAD